VVDSGGQDPIALVATGTGKVWIEFCVHFAGSTN